MTIAVAASAQAINEDFNDGWPDGWTTIDNGDNEGTWAWNDQYGIDGTGCADLDTWDGDLPNSGQADDWMITPQVTVEDGDMVSFYAVCSADYPDEISVMVSKGDASVDDFTIALVENMELTGDYVKYEYSLTDNPDINAGDDIYVAIHCNSNGSWVDVDDFYLGPTMATLFETFENGIPENWTTVDGGANEGTWDTVSDGGLEESAAAWVDCYDPGPSDDWLMTHQVTIAEGDYLSFWVDMGYEEFHDTLYVRISTASNAVEDFTVEVDDIITTTADYTKFNYNLADVEGVSAGDAVYVGFHAASWGSKIWLDNVRMGAYQPPVFNEAYAMSETELVVMYDIEVTEGDINLADIELDNGDEIITFSGYSIDPNDAKKVHLTGASSNMVGDNVLDILKNTAFEYEVEFYAGILPLTYTSITNPDGDLIYDGPMGTFKGIVTYKNDDGSRVWLSDAEGAHHSVNTYQSGGSLADSVNIGDEVLVYGALSPYENQTEIYPASYITTLSSGNSLFPATLVEGSDIAADNAADEDPAEMYEGVLISVEDAVVQEMIEEFVLDNSDTITVALCNDGEANFYVGDNLGIYNGEFTTSSMNVGSTYNVTGILVNKGGKYVVAPRLEADLSEVTGLSEVEEEAVLKAYPNPVSDYLNIEANQEVNRVVVFNARGERVLSKDISGTTEVNMKSLQGGVYFVRFFNDDEWIQTSRIVKR